MKPWQEFITSNASPVVTGTLTAALLWWWVVIRRHDTNRSRRALLPRPSTTLPVLGNTIDILTQLPRLHDWLLDESQRQGGKPWLIQVVGSAPIVVACSVALASDIWKHQFDVFENGDRTRAIFEDVGRHNIVSLDGEEWKQQRRIMNHLFTMRRFRDTITGSIQTHLVVLGRVLDREAERQQQVVLAGRALRKEEEEEAKEEEAKEEEELFYDLGTAFDRLSFDTFMKVAFGSESNSLEDATNDAFINALATNFRAITLRFLEPDFVWRLKRFFNYGSERELRTAMKVVDEHLFAIITETLQRNTDQLKARSSSNSNSSSSAAPHRSDIVSLAVEYCSAKHEEYAAISFNKTELRDIGLAVITAGKDTTNTALSWLFITLASHPRVVSEIRRELKASLPQLFTDRGYVPEMPEIEGLVYLEAVVRETLRLHPVVPLTSREANRDTTLSDGTFIAKGSEVYIPIYAIGRMPSVWGDDAEQFQPERWLEPMEDGAVEPGQKLRTFPAFQYMQFGGGPRICVGRRYAMMNLKATVAYVLSKYEVTPKEEPATYTYKIMGTLSLQGPLLARITKL